MSTGLAKVSGLFAEGATVRTMIDIKAMIGVVKCAILLGALSVTLTTKIAAQQQWETYQPRTLRQIIKEHVSEVADGRGRVIFLLTAESFPSKVKAVYTGKSRAISSKRLELISEWAKARKVDKEIVELFKQELLFLEGSEEHWLPAQQSLIPYFRREIQTGESVELFVVWIGARKELNKPS